MDIKPKLAKRIYQRANETDFQPAIGMYGELLRCFGQVKLGMELCCTRVTWLTLDEMIEKALKEAFLKLKENGTFLKEAEGILDMVFQSQLYSKADLIRCFQTEQHIHVHLLLMGLTNSEKTLLM